MSTSSARVKNSRSRILNNSLSAVLPLQYDAQEDGPPSGGESDTGSEGVKPRRGAVGRKRGRVSGRGSGAGPPVDGALARVDVWQPDCDIHGNPHGKVNTSTPWDNSQLQNAAPASLSLSDKCNSRIWPYCWYCLF